MTTQAPSPSPSITQLRDQVAHLEQSLEDARGHLQQLQAATPAGPDSADYDDVATLTQARAAHATAFEQHQLKLQSAGDLITTLSERLAAKRAELAQAEASANVGPDLSKFLATGHRFKQLMAEAEACFAELEKEAEWLLSEGYRTAFPRTRSANTRTLPLTVSGWPEHRRWPYVLVDEKSVAIGAGDYFKQFQAEDERNANLND